jgi:hypothetical protein
MQISAAVQAQGKALVGGLVAAIVAAEAPLVQGGHWSLSTLYAAAISAVVGYLLVWAKANGPSEVNALLGLLVGHTTHPVTTTHTTVTAAPAAAQVTPTVPSDLTGSIEAALASGRAAASSPAAVQVVSPAPVDSPSISSSAPVAPATPVA